ncbi:sugar phosphate isomerase/epimerase family protein [Haloarcula nitratireducens]|uniref:Sugar phosphate isomerase/epimerase n=1 Tax=Haloarcula nitratireducens TaxID=2487749 RepID=A0AAW4PI51_9EURY|nr:sugar phosphate isomerase/epimerase [Halomicroarcula nitratireducens]MBX0296877.1 sugar phosphate isomerase/epimerase [Halomicroarcula nitratireducens]
MGVGYATIMYDSEAVESRAIGDFAACRYDGVEIGLEKVEALGEETLNALLEDYDLDLYCVMAGWLNTEEDLQRAVNGAELAGNLGSNFLGILPPPRGVVDDETFAEWLDTICEAAADAGVTPIVHHHFGAHVEQPEEIRRWLDEGPDNLQLLFDTAHYYAYGDITDGIERFADDIAYVHLKDIDPPAEFQLHVDNLTAGKKDYDSIVNYIWAFTDLGEGIIDFSEVFETLDSVGYDGHTTIEIENQMDHPLVHAKKNIDHLEAVTDV